MADAYDTPNRYKVRLISVLNEYERVNFDVTPSFQESRSVEYTPVVPLHIPGAIQVYKHTNSRNFSITARFISRNIDDALKNMFKLQTLRGWTMPYFGQYSSTLTAEQRKNRNDMTSRTNPAKTSAQTAGGSQDRKKARIVSQEDTGVELLGAPPMILYLYAYSTSANDNRPSGYVNINRVPVVITSLDFTYPEDVDYIPNIDPTSNLNVLDPSLTEAFPVRMDVSVSLVETHSPIEYERFSLSEYKQGKLPNF